MIPPLCYAKPQLAYQVNVGATANLVKALEAHPNPARLVQASSIAVYGPRNPHHITDVLTAQTPVNPYDNYGKHKVEAEGIVRASSLDWVILRLGGVLTTEPNLGMDPNLIFFEGVLPADGRLQTVDVRDVACAFAAATTADVAGQTLLIGGDDTHRLRQGDIGSATTAAMGLVGALPPGRKGDPNDDGGWFATDWMDSATAQQVLKHQHYSWPDMLAETADKVGWKRYAFRMIAPLAREYLKRQSPYYGQPPGYGNPWKRCGANGEPRRTTGRCHDRTGSGDCRRRVRDRLGDGPDPRGPGHPRDDRRSQHRSGSRTCGDAGRSAQLG